jgi:hypothetical protein
MFLDLVVDGSLFDHHKVFRGCVDVCIHDLIGMMIQLMLILLLELETWSKPPPHLKNLIIISFLQILPIHFLGYCIICIYLGFAFTHAGKETHFSPIFNHLQDYRVCKSAK